MGQSPGGGRMAVRRELAGLIGPQEEHTDSPLKLTAFHTWAVLPLQMSSDLVLLTIVDVSVFVGATLYLVSSPAHLWLPFLVEQERCPGV